MLCLTSARNPMRIVSVLSGDQSLTAGNCASRPRGVFAEEMALVSAGTTHVLTSLLQRSACHFAVLVDNKVQSHLEQQGQRSNRYRN